MEGSHQGVLLSPNWESGAVLLREWKAWDKDKEQEIFFNARPEVDYHKGDENGETSEKNEGKETAETEIIQAGWSFEQSDTAEDVLVHASGVVSKFSLGSCSTQNILCFYHCSTTSNNFSIKWAIHPMWHHKTLAEAEDKWKFQFSLWLWNYTFFSFHFWCQAQKKFFFNRDCIYLPWTDERSQSTMLASEFLHKSYSWVT